MSFPVTIELGNPDPLVPFTNPSDLCTLLRPLLSGSVEQDIQTFVYSYDTPAVEDQGLLWFRLDSDGRLKGVYNFFNAVWVREEPPVSARFGFFTGDPNTYFDASGLGLKGPGPIAMDYWGWALMNGENGTPNLSDRFLIMGAMDNVSVVGYDAGAGGWRTGIRGSPEGTGGSAEITLAEENLPLLTVGLHDADGSAPGGGPLYGTGTGATADIYGSSGPTAVSVVNPFYALALIQFVGYTG